MAIEGAVKITKIDDDKYEIVGDDADLVSLLISGDAAVPEVEHRCDRLVITESQVDDVINLITVSGWDVQLVFAPRDGHGSDSITVEGGKYV